MEARKDNENEWFARHESELLRQARRERQMREAQEKSRDAEQRSLHFMKCPKCGSDLSEEKLHDVVVDRCGSCQGVFFDRGEMEALLLKDSGAKRGFFRRLVGFHD
jgi:acetyl-CoA carboxylase beta subunit